MTSNVVLMYLISLPPIASLIWFCWEIFGSERLKAGLVPIAVTLAVATVCLVVGFEVVQAESVDDVRNVESFRFTFFILGAGLSVLAILEALLWAIAPFLRADLDKPVPEENLHRGLES